MRTSYRAITAAFGFALSMVPLNAGAADVDVGKTSLPAVSGPNGKIEISGGFGDLDEVDDDFILRGGAAFSIPLGENFGLQADVAAVDAFDDTMVGGAMHFFMRDPESYLLGVAGGAGFSEDANVYFIGPEAELYLGNVSVELWGGYLNVDVDGASSKDEWFGFGDLAFYATDDLRFSVGARSVAGTESGHAGLELQMAGLGLPVSLTADGTVGEDDLWTATVGFKLYFGGEDKSLIRRHREDDRRNRTLDLFSAAGSAFTKKTAAPAPGPDFGVCPTGESDIDPGPITTCEFDNS